MRGAGLLVLLICALEGGSRAPEARPRMPQPGANAPKLSGEEIGRNSFGSAFRSARKEAGSAEFVFSAPEEGTPADKYRRSVLLASTAIPATTRNEPKVDTIRFTAIDPK